MPNSPILPESNTYIWTASITIFSIVGVFIFVFILSLVRHQRKFIKLQKERIKAEVEALEKERTRVASDLHDSLGPFLSAIKLHINSLDTSIPEDIEIIKKTSTNLDTVIKSIRTIANNLMPNVLYHKGLHAAILDFINTIQNNFPLKINYYNETKVDLNTNASINIFRILQEVIHNTIKHAKGTTLLIKIYINEKQFIILTQDNGIGFNVKEKEDSFSGLGLKNLYTRVEILNGMVEIKSEPNKGSTFIFDFLLTNLLKDTNKSKI